MLNEIAKDIAATVRESVQAGIKVLSDKFETRLKAVEERFSALPIPKDGEPGKSITVEDVTPLLKELVNAIEIPAPVKGDPGQSVTIEDVRPVIDKAVQQAAQNIKVPEVDYTAVKQFISEEVSTIPKPQDGKSITVDDVQPLLKEMVDAIEIPSAEKGEKGDPGNSIAIDDVRPLIDDAVEKTTQHLFIDYALVKKYISEEVSAIPKPEDGKSVTLDEVKPLIADAVKSAVAEMPVPRDGEPGKDGAPGKDAEPLGMAIVQRMIDDAVAQAVAKINIPEPRNGEDGKDALDIEILPEIDPEKSYNRNSYAVHKGGLWHSYERTKGMRGWETVVDGIADIQIDYDGERGVKIITEKSSGEVVAKEFVIPAMIYREVYKEGQSYSIGDTVTWAGSTWTCLKSTQEKPGSSSDTWRLSVKAGRNANQTVKVVV